LAVHGLAPPVPNISTDFKRAETDQRLEAGVPSYGNVRPRLIGQESPLRIIFVAGIFENDQLVTWQAFHLLVYLATLHEKQPSPALEKFSGTRSNRRKIVLHHDHNSRCT
jgi:hypothetical protein